MKKRLISSLLILAMVLTLFPVTAFAANAAVDSVELVYKDGGNQIKIVPSATYTSTDTLYYLILNKDYDAVAASYSTWEQDLGVGQIYGTITANNYSTTNPAYASVTLPTSGTGDLRGKTAKIYVFDATSGQASLANAVTGETAIDSEGYAPRTSFTITWNVDGTETTDSQYEGSKLTLPTAPTKPGYNFKGWFTAATDGTQVTGNTTVSAAATYYAQWTEKGTLTAANFEVKDTYTYNGNPQDVTVVPKSGVTGTGAISYTAGQTETNAGNSYEVTFDVAESNDYKAATGLKLTWAIAKATPTVTVPSATDENTTLQQIVDGVTVTGVKDGDLDKTGFKLFDGDTEITDLTAKVVPEKVYQYSYTPSGTNAANYNAVDKTPKTLLGQSKVDVVFTADPKHGTIKTGSLVGGLSTITVPVTIGEKVTPPDVNNTDASKYRFLGWTLDPDADPVEYLTSAQVAEETVTEALEYIAIFEVPDHPAYMIGVDEEKNLFDPNGDMTRAQAAVMLARLDGHDVTQPYGVKSSYTDIGAATAAWAQSAIDYVTDQGYMNGRSDAEFDPDTAITRQEMAVILARWAEYTEDKTSPSFDDIGQAADWAKGWITALKVAGKINGYDNKNFGPTDNLTRAQAAKMVNYVTDCIPDETKISKDLLRFVDVKGMDDWAVYNVIEATVDHFSVDFHK